MQVSQLHGNEAAKFSVPLWNVIAWNFSTKLHCGTGGVSLALYYARVKIILKIETWK